MYTYNNYFIGQNESGCKSKKHFVAVNERYMFAWHDARDDMEVSSTWSTAWQLETSHVNHMLYQFVLYRGESFKQAQFGFTA